MTFSFGPSENSANRTNTVNKQSKHPMAGDHDAKPKQEPNSEAEPSGWLSFCFFIIPTTFCPSIHPSISITLHQTAHTNTQKKTEDWYWRRAGY